MSASTQELAGLQGLVGQKPDTTPSSVQALHPGLPGSVSTQELSGLQTLLSAKDADEPTPEEQQSKTRQMMVSGMTGMPSPVMNDQDKAEFAQGKVAGAISVPAVAGAYLGAHAALSAGIPPLMKALTAGAVAVGEWAAQHPVAAKIIWHAVGAAITGTAAGAGARVAGKVIRSSGE